jgi:hypothetical protein
LFLLLGAVSAATASCLDYSAGLRLLELYLGPPM